MAVSRKPRRPASKPKRRSAARAEKGRALPASAATTILDGREFVILPADDFAEWLEDQIDIALAREAMADAAPPIPIEEVHRRLGIK